MLFSYISAWPAALVSACWAFVSPPEIAPSAVPQQTEVQTPRVSAPPEVATPAVFTPDEAIELPPPIAGSSGSYQEVKPAASMATAWYLNPPWRKTPADIWTAYPHYYRPANHGVLINDVVTPVVAELPLDEGKPFKLTVVGNPPTSKPSANCPYKVCPGATCKHCNCDCPEDCPADALQPGEAAKVILDVMENIGRSVLDGSVFQKSQKGEEWLPGVEPTDAVSPKQALVNYIRRLDAEHQQGRRARLEFEICDLPQVPAAQAVHRARECDVNIGGECCPAGCSPAHCTVVACCTAQHSSVNSLRDASEALEQAAAMLERQNLYDRADQLREVARELRQDARAATRHEHGEQVTMRTIPLPPPPPMATWELPIVPHMAKVRLSIGASKAEECPPAETPTASTSDLETKLQQLREELRKTQEAIDAGMKSIALPPLYDSTVK